MSHQRQLSTILVPIICSLFAVVIVVSGTAYHYHTRAKVRIEVADFDFSAPPEELTEMSFSDRVRIALREALGAQVPECQARDLMRRESHSSRSYGTIA